MTSYFQQHTTVKLASLVNITEPTVMAQIVQAFSNRTSLTNLTVPPVVNGQRQFGLPVYDKKDDEPVYQLHLTTDKSGIFPETSFAKILLDLGIIKSARDIKVEVTSHM